MVVDAINRIDVFTKELQNNMPAISTEVAGLFLSTKIEQIRKVGFGKQYKTKTYSAHYLRGKELNASGKTFIENKIKAKEKTNWQQLRAAQGLQVQFVDLYYSGQMLNSTGLIRNNTASYRYYSIIGGRNAEAKAKLAANYKRYGNFLYPTPAQGQIMGTRAVNLIGVIYKRILLTT